MNDQQQPQPIELDCPYCETPVACLEYDEIVICPHCNRKCRQTSDYIDSATDQVIFALVPFDQ